MKQRQGKDIQRTEYDDYVDDNIDRVTFYKSLYQKRQAIVEHPCLTGVKTDKHLERLNEVGDTTLHCSKHSRK